MTVHIILNSSFPYGGALTNRILHYADGLKKNGIECKIVVPFPHDKYNNIHNKDAKGSFEGIDFIYTANITYRSKNFIKRRINDCIGYIGTISYLIKETKKKDIIICTSPNTINYLFIILLCKIFKLITISELNELPFVFCEQTPKIINKRNKFFNGIFKKFDAHIVISDTLYDIAKKNTDAPIIKVPIIINTDATLCIKDNTNPEKAPFIFHSGTLTEKKDGICGMLEAFGIAKNELKKDIMFISTGYLEKSPDKNKIYKIIEKYGLKDSVKFLGYIDTETLRRYQKYCSLVIINKYPTLQNKYCFATKTGEYLIFRRPIIMTNVGEAMNYFKDNDNAYIIEPNNPILIAEKIIHIYKNKEIAETIGDRGYRLVEKEFNHIYQAKRMLKFFNSLVN